VLRLEVLADAQRAVGVDPPRELDPELVLLPDLAWVGLTGVFDSLSQPLASGAQDRLAEADPLGVMRLVRVEVMTLRAVSHGQHVVAEAGGLAPARREGDVKADPGLVCQHLDPAEPVWIGPDRVVDAREVDLEAAAALVQKGRPQE